MPKALILMIAMAVIAAAIDYWSTNRAIKAGGYETNRLEAWFQKIMGPSWWWVGREGVEIVPLGAAVWLFSTGIYFAQAMAIGLTFMVNAYILMTAWENLLIAWHRD